MLMAPHTHTFRVFPMKWVMNPEMSFVWIQDLLMGHSGGTGNALILIMLPYVSSTAVTLTTNEPGLDFHGLKGY